MPLDDAAPPEDHLLAHVDDHVHEIAEITVGQEEIARDWAEVDGFLVSPPLEAPEGATRVGALVTLVTAGMDIPQLEARGIDANGNVGRWQPLETQWAEQDLFVAHVDLDAFARAAELRVPAHAYGTVLGMTWSALVPLQPEPQVEPPAFEDDDIGRTTQALRSEFANIGVNSRASWGARATRCSTNDTSKTRISIHHTVTPSNTDPPVRLRGIQAYHMDTQGWCDIGYHFLVSLDGRLWEGRAAHLLGTHVANNNSRNLGISYIGCFHTSGCSNWTPFTPPDVMIQSGAKLVRTAAQVYGITVSSSTVIGHRDNPGASTSCPGANLHSKLGQIRSLASEPEAPPQLRAQYVHQTFPLASQPFELRPGERVSGYLEMRNTGGVTWEPGKTFLATTEPREGASPLVGPDWISPSRAATIDSTVPPNGTGRFNFTVQAPLTPGEYPQYFNLMHEGVGWFGDPGQGGPPDAHIQIRVTVLNEPPVVYDAGMPPAEPDAGAPEPSDAGIEPMPGTDAGGGAVFPDPEQDGGVGGGHGGGRSSVSGCGCATAGANGDDGYGALFALLALAVAVRRRSRTGR